MRDICTVWLAELKRIFTDHGVTLIAVAAISIYSLVYPIPYSNQVLTETPILVVDQDNSSLSRKLIRMADASELVSISGRAGSLDEARQQVTANQAAGVLVIPADFERRILRGSTVTVGLYADASYLLIYRQALTGLMGAVKTLSAGIEIRRLQAAGLPQYRAMTAREPIGFISRALFNPAEGYATYVVPGVFVLLMQQTLLISLGMIGGTWSEQGRSRSGQQGRIGLGATMVGRSAAFLTLYLGHTIFLFGFMQRFWGFPQMGDLGSIMLFLTPFLTASIGMGLALSTLFRSRETAMQILLFTSLVAIFMAGFSWPSEAMPDWVRALASLFPSTAGIMGVLKVSQLGASLKQVQGEWYWLWGLTGFYYFCAWLLLRRKGRPDQVEKNDRLLDPEQPEPLVASDEP